MTNRSPIRCAAALAALACAVAAGAVTEPPPEPRHLGLYEWMGTAPVVVAGDIVSDDGKFVTTAVAASIKGGVPTGSFVLVDLRATNRGRDEGTRPLKLEKGSGYLLLLEASSKGKNEPNPVFDLVRGVQGARPLPVEGRPALVDAATKLGSIQERKSDELLWESLPSFLEDDNPHLVNAALELYLKFRRESVDLVPRLEPLLESPRPTVREQSVELLGRLLARTSPAELPSRSVIVGELTGRARRDDVASVRAAAAAALAPLADPGIDETLRAIARDDADQFVRFAAEKSLYERTLTKSGPRSAD
jgi:HEAT repeats